MAQSSRPSLVSIASAYVSDGAGLVCVPHACTYLPTHRHARARQARALSEAEISHTWIERSGRAREQDERAALTWSAGSVIFISVRHRSSFIDDPAAGE